MDWTDATGRTYVGFERGRDSRSVRRDQPEAGPAASKEVSMRIVKINDVEYVDLKATFEGVYSNGNFIVRMDEGESTGLQFTIAHSLYELTPSDGTFGLPEFKSGDICPNLSEFKSGDICPNQHTTRLRASYARERGILAPDQR